VGGKERDSKARGPGRNSLPVNVSLCRRELEMSAREPGSTGTEARGEVR